MTRHATATDRAPLVRSGLVLGFALNGFLDGIVFHQVLRWHHMLSRWTDDLDLNLLADGLFHLAMWFLVVLGLVLFWRARRSEPPQPGRIFVGALLIGAGVFQLVDSLVDHALLGVHHIHPDWPLVSDLVFLGVGLALLAMGLVLVRTRRVAGS